MSDDDKEISDLELYDGDVSLVVRGTGELEFVLACGDETSEEYLRGLQIIDYLRFALESEQCRELFLEDRKKREVLN